MSDIDVEIIDDSINVSVEGGIGPQGPPGATGQGVPTGGTSGQILTKDSGTDYDTSWQTPSPSGVSSVGAGNNIDVDNTDPANPVVSVETLTLSDISDVTASATEVNVLDGIPGTLTATELGYVDGVTSSIQSQLNNKIENLSAFDTDDLAEGTTNLYSQWQLDAVGSRRYVSPKTEGDVLYIGNRDAASALESSFSAATAMFPGNNTNGTNYFINPAYGSSFIPFGGLFVAGKARGTHASPTDTQDGDWIGGLGGVNYLNGGWTGGTTFILPGMYMSQLDHSSSDFGTRLYLGSALFEALTVDMAITGTPQPTVYINRPNADVDFQVNWDGGTAIFVEGSSGNTLFDGDIEIASSSNGLILESPDTTRWRVTVDNEGSLTTTEI